MKLIKIDVVGRKLMIYLGGLAVDGKLKIQGPYKVPCCGIGVWGSPDVLPFGESSTLNLMIYVGMRFNNIP